MARFIFMCTGGAVRVDSDHEMGPCQPTSDTGAIKGMEKETKSKQFALRMRPAVYAAGERAAADEERSLGWLMEKLLVEHLKANGYLPKDGKPAGKRK